MDNLYTVYVKPMYCSDGDFGWYVDTTGLTQEQALLLVCEIRRDANGYFACAKRTIDGPPQATNGDFFG